MDEEFQRKQLLLQYIQVIELCTVSILRENMNSRQKRVICVTLLLRECRVVFGKGVNTV